MWLEYIETRNQIEVMAKLLGYEVTKEDTAFYIRTPDNSKFFKIEKISNMGGKEWRLIAQSSKHLAYPFISRFGNEEVIDKLKGVMEML